MEFSTNLSDLKLDIGIMIQKLQNGEEDDPPIIIENLENIQKSITKIANILGGGID